MTLILLPTLVLAVIFCTRRAAVAERRREERVDVSRAGTAMVLGQEETRTSCRVLNVSRSGMRMAAAHDFTVGIQVMVEWENEFFVGSIRYALTKGEEKVYGLRLVTRGGG
jgi:hypothetical protein